MGFEKLCLVVILQKRLPLQTMQLELYHYLSLPFQFPILPESTMKVTKDTVTITGLGLTGDTVQLKDADPNELQLFIDKMPATIKGKSVKYGF